MGFLVVGVGVFFECFVIVDDLLELFLLIDFVGLRIMVIVLVEWFLYFLVLYIVGIFIFKKLCFVEVGSVGFVNGFDGILIIEIYSILCLLILCRIVLWIYL